MKTLVHSGSLSTKTPISFADGSTIYKAFSKKYRLHKKGLFILAPSGVGKTYFIKQQKTSEWMDGDALWEATNAHPKGSWWLEPLETITEIDQRSDIVTAQAKKLGFWMMGASNAWLKPDAVVLPDWKTHQKYIITREQTNYDGGATSKSFAQVQNHRKWMRRWAKQGVPIFTSIQEAVDALTQTH